MLGGELGWAGLVWAGLTGRGDGGMRDVWRERVDGWVGGNKGGVYIHATCPVVVIERPARNGIALSRAGGFDAVGFFQRGEDRRRVWNADLGKLPDRIGS